MLPIRPALLLVAVLAPSAWGQVVTLPQHGASLRTPLATDVQPACSARESGQHTLRTADGTELYVEANTAVAAGRSLLVAGSPTYVWRRSANGQYGDPPRDSIFGAIIHANDAVTAVPVPFAGRFFGDPRAVALADDRWGVFFFEFDRLRPRDGSRKATGAWFGVVDRTGWHSLEAAPLPRPDSVHTFRTSSLVRLNGDRLAIAYIVDAPAPRLDYTLHLQRNARGTWTQDTIPHVAPASVTLVAVRDTGTVAFLVAPGRPIVGPHDQNSIFRYERSPRWTQTRRIVEGGIEGVHGSAVHVDADRSYMYSWWRLVGDSTDSRTTGHVLVEDSTGHVLATGVLESSTERLIPVASPRSATWLWVSEINDEPPRVGVVALTTAGVSVIGSLPHPFRAPFAATSRAVGSIVLTGPLQGNYPAEPVVRTQLVTLDIRCPG